MEDLVVGRKMLIMIGDNKRVPLEDSFGGRSLSLSATPFFLSAAFSKNPRFMI